MVTEGNWNPERLVVIEFKSMKQLKEWYDSEEYSDAMNIRHLSADTNLLFVEGIY